MPSVPPGRGHRVRLTTAASYAGPGSSPGTGGLFIAGGFGGGLIGTARAQLAEAARRAQHCVRHRHYCVAIYMLVVTYPYLERRILDVEQVGLPDARDRI